MRTLARKIGFYGITTDFASYEETAAKLAVVHARIHANTELIAATKGASKNPSGGCQDGIAGQ